MNVSWIIKSVFYKKQFMQDQELVKHMVNDKMNEVRQTKFVNE